MQPTLTTELQALCYHYINIIYICLAQRLSFINSNIVYTNNFKMKGMFLCMNNIK